MPLKSIFKSIRSGDIRVNSLKVKPNNRVENGDTLMIYKPLLKNRSDSKKIESGAKLDKNRIVFENSHILIYNKPEGTLVHGEKNSLDKQVKNYLADKVEKSLSFSPGPLHRLDRNTNGLIVFSISLYGARTFTRMIQDNEISKNYLTIVDGIHTNYEKWIDTIDRDEKLLKSYKSEKGKTAITTFTPLFYKKNRTVALIGIETGRTHQIRVQCSIHNRPLTGDLKYNNSTPYKEYYLSAISLTFLQKSDIVNNKERFILPLKSSANKIIKNLLTNEELSSVECLVQKELGKR